MMARRPHRLGASRRSTSLHLLRKWGRKSFRNDTNLPSQTNLARYGCRLTRRRGRCPFVAKRIANTPVGILPQKNPC
jgi:hypothetical protein